MGTYAGIDLLPGEQILWQGSPAHRSVFLRTDPRWMRFSLKFNAAVFLLLTVVAGLLNLGLGVVDGWSVTCRRRNVRLALSLVAPHDLLRHRPTRRVRARQANAVGVARRDRQPRVHGGRGRFGYVRLDRRYLPDGFGNRTVAELIQVPEVRAVVTLLSTSTGREPLNID